MAWNAARGRSADAGASALVVSVIVSSSSGPARLRPS
jgi:hypothetical protein